MLLQGLGAEDVAHRFHVLYEQTAPEMGYRTRMDTRAWDPKSDNGRLMIAVVERILPEIEALVREKMLREPVWVQGTKVRVPMTFVKDGL